MNKVIYINESQVQVLHEAANEFTFFSFFTEIKGFIKQLLSDPINARPSQILTSHGVTDKMLRQELINRGVVVRSEKIDEPYDEVQGKTISKYHLSYKVPKKDFKRKLRRMYQALVESRQQ